MGLMRFNVGDWDRLPDDRMGRVFLATSDEMPYASRVWRSGDQLVVERRENDSACLWVPWRHDPGPAGESVGEWLVGSSTLMQRDEPYLLEVELARGSVYRLRNQMAIWKQLGLVTEDDFEGHVAEATRLFCRAATRQADPAGASAAAAEAIAAAAEASLELAAIYATQAMEVRQSSVERLPTLLGVRLGPDPPDAADDAIAAALSTVCVRCEWSAIERTEGKRRWKASDAQVQWAQKSGMRLCGGPLIDFADAAIPDWSYLWEGDFEAIAGLLVGHVEAVVKRYRGRVQLWNVAGRINRSGVLGLTDEQRLQLVARAVRVVRESDPKSPAVVSLEQPWGDYLANEPSDLTPIDFADALERADLGIAGFGLELNLGDDAGCVPMRSPLAFSRLLDQWSMRLESPLMLEVAAPSPADASGDEVDQQLAWAERCLPMLAAKNCVQVVLWNAHRDGQPNAFPRAGLLDEQGQPKPALAALRRLREAHLV